MRKFSQSYNKQHTCNWTLISNWVVISSHPRFKKIFIPRIRSNSCALPRANTGIRHRPPRLTMSWTVPRQTDKQARMHCELHVKHTILLPRKASRIEYYHPPPSKSPIDDLLRGGGRHDVLKPYMERETTKCPKLVPMLIVHLSNMRQTFVSLLKTFKFWCFKRPYSYSWYWTENSM